VTTVSRERAALIALQGVSKTYRTSEAATPVVALHSVNLRIFENDYVAITGPSGSGKSTLMNILGCLDQPSGGAYLLHGRDTVQLSEGELAALRNRTFGFIFQGYNLLPRATVLRNVTQPLIYRGVPRQERNARALEALARVGLAKRVHHYPHQLSGGEQQRVAIARAVCATPSILIGDEPTGNLDSKAAEMIMQIFDQLHSEGQTILIVTHSDKIAERCSSRIELEDGHLRAFRRNTYAAVS